MSKIKCKVVGPCAIAGVRKPGTVELDDERINITALVKGGHVEVVESKPAKVEK